MSMRFPRYGLPLLFLALAACDRAEVSVTGPTALSSAISTTESLFTLQPATLHPEFLPGNSCVPHSPFGTRIIVIVGGHRDVILRALRFRFVDRAGVNIFPRVAPIPGASPLLIPVSNIPASFRIELPGVAPLPAVTSIPVPGGTSVSGLFVPSGSSHTLPFFLTFDCGIEPEGNLFVFIDTATAAGALHTSELRVRLGR